VLYKIMRVLADEAWFDLGWLDLGMLDLGMLDNGLRQPYTDVAKKKSQPCADFAII
jgi:hypothetical protein